MRASLHACAVMPWGGGGTRLGLGCCSYDASTGLPPGLEVGGLEVKSGRRSAVAGRLSGGGVENGGGACKNPWRRARGKRFPALFCWLLWGEMYPAHRRGPWRGKISEADGGPGPWTAQAAL